MVRKSYKSINYDDDICLGLIFIVLAHCINLDVSYKFSGEAAITNVTIFDYKLDPLDL